MENLRNNKVSFYEHLEPLLELGKEFYGTSQVKGLLCNGARIEPARWSQFANKTKNFTGYYVHKILKSLNLTPNKYVETTGMAFTNEQIEELKAQKFVDYNKEFIIDLVRLESPETIELFKKVLKNPERLEVLQKLFTD